MWSLLLYTVQTRDPNSQTVLAVKDMASLYHDGVLVSSFLVDGNLDEQESQSLVEALAGSKVKVQDLRDPHFNTPAPIV